jgi:hypothetical protein
MFRQTPTGATVPLLDHGKMYYCWTARIAPLSPVNVRAFPRTGSFFIFYEDDFCLFCSVSQTLCVQSMVQAEEHIMLERFGLGEYEVHFLIVMLH